MSDDSLPDVWIEWGTHESNDGIEYLHLSAFGEYPISDECVHYIPAARVEKYREALRDRAEWISSNASSTSRRSGCNLCKYEWVGDKSMHAHSCLLHEGDRHADR